MVAAAGGSSENFAPKASENAAAAKALHILALLPEVETVASCLHFAIAAGGPASVISAVHVGFDPLHTFVSAEEQDIQQLRDIYEGNPQDRLARIKSAFDAFVANRPDVPPVYWKNDEGDIDVNVALEAHDADLIVIGHPLHMDASDALHSALFGAHRLVLVVPRTIGAAQKTIGRHMVVGWKPGDPVKHAINAALPWLRAAEKVSVLWVEKPGVEPYDASAREFFAKIGIDMQMTGLQRNHRSVGEQILDEAARLGGDSLLIGAFKHGSLWDAVFGGVTRDVLRRTDIPVFLMQ
jgi:nucleotide-binding universal stress UspA family protein